MLELVFRRQDDGGPAPGSALDDDQLARAYPWPDAGTWVRAMMLVCLDGAAAGPDHLSKSISGAADRRIMAAARRYSDVILIGAATMRAEHYSPVRAKDTDISVREEAGQLSAPVLAIVSGSLDLPFDLPVWTESTQRPLVITGPAPDAAALAAAREAADVVQLPAVSPHAVVEALSSRGLRRIVCEGGPTFLREMVVAGVVDEGDITVSPLLPGTGTSPRTEVLSHPARARLEQVLRGGDFLMNRYLLGDR